MFCRLLPHETADGASNMALDHALLDAIDAEPDTAVLRTYGWSEPTLSLGYFQKVEQVRLDPRWNRAPVVRRPSGGGALWHHHELTYALIVPRSRPLARRPSDLYRAVHGAIVGMLLDFGVEAERRGESPANPARPFLCFLDRDPEDILIHGRKIVGGAQRRRPRAVLQHGSLLLARSERTPELPGLRDLTDQRFDATTWTTRIHQAIAGVLGLEPIASKPSAAERDQAEKLARSIYRDPHWTRKR